MAPWDNYVGIYGRLGYRSDDPNERQGARPLELDTMALLWARPDLYRNDAKTREILTSTRVRLDRLFEHPITLRMARHVVAREAAAGRSGYSAPSRLSRLLPTKDPDRADLRADLSWIKDSVDHANRSTQGHDWARFEKTLRRRASELGGDERALRIRCVRLMDAIVRPGVLDAHDSLLEAIQFAADQLRYQEGLRPAARADPAHLLGWVADKVHEATQEHRPRIRDFANFPATPEGRPHLLGDQPAFPEGTSDFVEFNDQLDTHITTLQERAGSADLMAVDRLSTLVGTTANEASRIRELHDDDRNGPDELAEQVGESLQRVSDTVEFARTGGGWVDRDHLRTTRQLVNSVLAGHGRQQRPLPEPEGRPAIGGAGHSAPTNNLSR